MKKEIVDFIIGELHGPVPEEISFYIPQVTFDILRDALMLLSRDQLITVAKKYEFEEVVA